VTTFAESPAPTTCERCGTQIATALLSCPQCQRLVHAARLATLAETAKRAEQAGQSTAALEAWRTSAELLPSESKQHQIVSERIAALVAAGATSNQHDTKTGKTPRWIAALGPIGLLLWKSKALALLLVTKGKLLLFGLTKIGTLFSMLATVGVYWTQWGFAFAAGFVASIYIHEIGHVDALRRYGIEATPPMFIPGFGAFVRLKQRVLNPIEDARIGLAGPVWGLAAAVVAYVIGTISGAQVWFAIARTGAWINLFNLVPIWQLDGNRGLHAVGRAPRWALVAVAFMAFIGSGQGLLALLGVVLAVRAFGGDAPASTDRRAFATFAVLLVSLAWLSHGF
jgi:Zn-dependent protease